VSEFRRRDKARLEAQFSTGDMHAGAQHSFGGQESDAVVLDDA
jgi:glutathione-regulated potassium-efflux system protein KefB